MRKVTLFIIGALFFFVFSGQLKAADPFSDIHEYPYRESIVFLYERGVVQGYNDLTFRPDQGINRAEMLKIILSSTQNEEGIGRLRDCFKDVQGAWYARYVCFAKTQGIISGYPDGQFRPGQDVNMAEGLKIGLETFEAKLKAAGSSWYTPYTDFAHRKNLFSKYSYSPARAMTRGEMAFLIHQLLLDKEGVEPLTDRPPNLSEGCGKNPPASPPTSSVVSGMTRTYLTNVPSDYNKDQPKKLIFAWHGRTNPNTQVRGYYKVEQAAGKEAIMVYPQALPDANYSGAYNWADPGDSYQNLRDYNLFDQLLAEFSVNYCIDLDHVYVVGHSQGAYFTNSLACFRADKIRAAGSLGGGTWGGPRWGKECVAPVAIMIWHNPKDRLVPFANGQNARNQFLIQNACSSVTVPTEPSTGNCVEYQDCVTGAPTVWCPHNVDHDFRGEYYPHTWPKFTGEAIWNFFKSLE